MRATETRVLIAAFAAVEEQAAPVTAGAYSEHSIRGVGSRGVQDTRSKPMREVACGALQLPQEIA